MTKKQILRQIEIVDNELNELRTGQIYTHWNYYKPFDDDHLEKINRLEIKRNALYRALDKAK